MRPKRKKGAVCKQTAYYRRRMAELFKVVGEECVLCGSKEDLTIDHVDGIGWERNAVSSSARVARYWRELEAGVRLRTLCNSCNGRDGQKQRSALVPAEGQENKDNPSF